LTDTDKQNSTKNAKKTKYNSEKQTTQNTAKTTPIQSPLTTLGKEN